MNPKKCITCGEWPESARELRVDEYPYDPLSYNYGYKCKCDKPVHWFSGLANNQGVVDEWNERMAK